MMGNNQNLFFSPEEKGRAFSDVLKEVQEYISSKYSTLMVEGGNDEVKQQVKRYISKYIADYRITVKGKTREELINDLYTEMAEFSFLTKYIFGTGIEEIDINSWKDIEVQYSDGRCEKMEEHFESPEHAINVIRRMLHVSGMVLDNASPAVLGHLSKNIRIAVLKTPLVDEDVGIAASIRIVNPQSLKKSDFVDGGTATDEMLDFLAECLRYGISICVAGATSSGKTTLAGWLLTTIPDNKRIFTIENGSRELALVREKDGKVTNSVIHTFPFLCTVSLVLFAVGAAGAAMLGNFFLVPVAAVGFMFLPFWYIKLTASYFKKDVSAELETALSIITTAYLRSEDILTSVEENLEYLNPPVKNIFQDFVSRIRLINPDLEAALDELRARIADDVFKEWVDALKACLYDRSLKTTLTPIVAKLSDMRIVNAELEYMVMEPRKEFITMLVLVVGNIPLLYFLNKDWYHTLMHTVVGQIMLSIAGIIIFVSTAHVIRLTKPIEYRS